MCFACAVQFWDADRFEQVFSLEGHKQEVLSLALSPKGTTLYSTSADRSIREWVRTDEIVILEEEQEKRLESALDKGLDEVRGVAPLLSHTHTYTHTHTNTYTNTHTTRTHTNTHTQHASCCDCFLLRVLER